MEWQRGEFDRATEYLTKNLGPKRLLHTFGVVQTATSLAAKYGVSGTKVAIVGLLHDAAKSMPPAEMLHALERAGLAKHPYVEGPAQLLHAPASAAVAELVFGIEDPEILEAIAWHPTGKPHPSPLLRLLLVADYCEPSRDFQGVEEIRALARQNVDAALLEVLKRKAAYVKSSHRDLHPATVETLKSLTA